MQTVTVTFTNSMNKSQTETFDVYARNELDRVARFQLVNDNPGRATLLLDWNEDEGEVEKMAATQAGLTNQAVLVIRH